MKIEHNDSLQIYLDNNDIKKLNSDICLSFQKDKFHLVIAKIKKEKENFNNWGD